MKSILDSSIVCYGKSIKNRILIQPMEGCDGTTSGAPDELTRRRYLRFARSGAGIIWFEAMAVTSEARANPRQLYINENTVDVFKSLLEEIRAESLRLFGFTPLIIAQLTHSGRYSKPNGTLEPIVAYRNSLWEQGKEHFPYTLATDDYCKDVVKKYETAASLAAKAGFDGIDVKCCHGYLFNEFLSAYDRDGIYGGSFENRTRLYFECIDSAKKGADSKAFVTTRLNACDCFPYPYGFGVNENNEICLAETKKIIAGLEKKGIELINITIGNPYLIPHFNRPWIHAPESGEAGMERIKNVTKELTLSFPETKFVMSALTFPGENAVEYAEKMLNENVAHIMGFGRMAFAYPSFYADYVKNGNTDKNKVCIKCGKCTELMRAGTVSGCVVRDARAYMPYYKKFVLKK